MHLYSIWKQTNQREKIIIIQLGLLNIFRVEYVNRKRKNENANKFIMCVLSTTKFIKVFKLIRLCIKSNSNYWNK